jgi:hypothetical protein
MGRGNRGERWSSRRELIITTLANESGITSASINTSRGIQPTTDMISMALDPFSLLLVGWSINITTCSRFSVLLTFDSPYFSGLPYRHVPVYACLHCGFLHTWVVKASYIHLQLLSLCLLRLFYYLLTSSTTTMPSMLFSVHTGTSTDAFGWIPYYSSGDPYSAAIGTQELPTALHNAEFNLRSQISDEYLVEHHDT